VPESPGRKGTGRETLATVPPVGSRRSTDDSTRSQIRGSTLLLAGQIFAVLVNLATQVLIVRYLSKTSYGAFAYGLSVVMAGEMVAGFGLRRGVTRFLPVYEERGELEKAAGALVFALVSVIALAVAVVVFVVGIHGVVVGPVDSEPAGELMMILLILLVPIHALGSLLDDVFAIFGHARAIMARKYVLAPTLRLAVVVLLALTASGVTALAAGYVAVGVAGIAAYSPVLARVLREHGLLSRIRARELAYPVRELLRFTVPLLSHDLLHVMVSAGLALLLGVMAGATEVASLRAVLPVSLSMTYVLSAFGILFVPMAARLVARGAHEELNRLYWQTAAWTAIISFPIFGLACAFADPLTVFLFGERYADSGDVLAVLVLGHFLTAATGPNDVLLSAHGEVRFLVWTNAAGAAACLGLGVALIATAGALGAAITTATVFVVLNVLRQIGLARLTAVRAVDRAYAGIYCVLAAAAGSLLVISAVTNPPLSAAVALDLALAGGVLVYAGRRLALVETFPELARVPLLHRLAAAGPR
jgi:O-antigen/teichoic acid export membrane protein